MGELVPILGNTLLRERLWRAADDGRLHHCYLFEGPEGVGKRLTAERFALFLNCEGEARPCGTCRPCRLILAGTHPDVIVVEPDTSRATRILSADQARGIIDALSLQRHSARRRVVILDPADALTEEAGNALLKTFEEPPAGTQFCLVTARPAALLQTVRSRSQRVRFGPVSQQELTAWLTARGLDAALAIEAEGSPGRALRLAEGEAQERQAVRDALREALGQPLHRLFAFTEAGGKKGDDGEAGAARVVDAVEELMADIVATAANRPPRHAHPSLRGWTRALWPGGVARMERHLAHARDRMRLNVNGRTVLDALLSNLNLELSQVTR